jgi:hypothetical protein
LSALFLSSLIAAPLFSSAKDDTEEDAGGEILDNGSS